MERKRMMEVGIAIIILLALGFLVWWMLRDKTPEEMPREDEKTQTLPNTTTNNRPTTTVDPEDVPKVQEVSAGTVARTFVERIGSYSSESNYQNVDDVLGVVTTSLAAELEADAERAREQSPNNGGYYGISTSYIGAKTVEESETEITLLVQTQREESFGSPGNSEVRYQEMEITLVQEEGQWKVNSYTWKD